MLTLTAEFTIVSGETTITGTKRLTAADQPGYRNRGLCLDEPRPLFPIRGGEAGGR